MLRIGRIRARLRSLPVWIPDGCLAVLVLSADLVSWFDTSPPRFPSSSWPDWLQLGCLTLGASAITFRRRAPLLVVSISGAALAASTWALVDNSAFGVLVALFTVASRRPRRQSAVALGLIVIAVGAAELHRGTPVGWLAVIAIVIGGAWILGDQRQTQHILNQELQRRAELLEREREHRIRLATADERGRIARDLHDVVAHSVSVMVLHAAAARRAMNRDPARAESALAQVETTGRQSLTELRQLLGLLRRDGHGAEFTPQPRLAFLDELVEGFREAGMPVHVRIDGELDQLLPPVVDLCAYRILQEALTNALKHANASLVTVDIRYRDLELAIEVVDDGRGRPGDAGDQHGDGHGLLGMRERAALVGGRLRAGHRVGGGFQVDAVLPLGA